MKKVFVVSKTHLDLGFTDYAESIRQKYIDKFIPEAIDLAEKVNTDGKKYVLCGDECYSARNLTDKIPTGASMYPDKSEAFVLEYSKTEYTPIITHDADIVENPVGFKIIF